MPVSDVPATGTRPAGATDEASAAAHVRQMFTEIAPRYDLLNHLLSFNIDKRWWKRAARTFAEILARADAHVLDLCCGTGHMAMALAKEAKRHGSEPDIVGADFSHAMLTRATRNFTGLPARAVEADALSLPFAPSTFDLVTSAFGFRNLANYDKGLAEIFRVLRPGGEAGILDFGEPKGVIGAGYRVYFRYVLPAVGTLISGVRGPYAYLPASVERFPEPEQMLARMRAAGFRDVSWTAYTCGIAGLYRGKK
jgi:demethylmenaquinone methyltransferase/2-methoxy-6-polyprenyl-1,4-benzoquinol methylase